HPNAAPGHHAAITAQPADLIPHGPTGIAGRGAAAPATARPAWTGAERFRAPRRPSWRSSP
ncbi:hypothetical protein, partial [Kitasatospora sp. NPDC059571]|uniref:hypothetical protein n=1 Tax=Kitasatospora sp. NPDC059571 TaxID=3346871 RepID=UPI0036C975E1